MATNRPPLTANASDTDGDSLNYSLDSAPAGATIDTNTGVFTFTPTVGPASYPVTVRVTDSDNKELYRTPPDIAAAAREIAGD